MAGKSKRAKLFAEKIEIGRQYPIDEAVTLLAELSSAKFKESVDVSINLGVDPRKSDQVVRGSTALRTVPVKSYGSLSSLKVLLQMPRKKRVQTSLAWKTLLMK